MVNARVILNGKSSTDPRFREAVTVLRRDGHVIDVRSTWEPGDVQRFTIEAMRDVEGAALDVIVAAGGDGTVNEVFGTAVDQAAAFGGSFGIVPLGTANDFARSVGIDANDITGALRRVADNEPTPVDIGFLNGKAFVNLVTGGFGSRVTAETDPHLKKRLGGLAYALTGLARLGDMTASKGRFRGEDFEWEGAFVALAIGNGRQAGGGIPLCPDAFIDDGLLDLWIMPSVPAEYRSQTLLHVLREGRSAIRALEIRTRSSWFTYEADDELNINLDGEPMTANAFRVDCRPGQLKLRLGASPLLMSRGTP